MEKQFDSLSLEDQWRVVQKPVAYAEIGKVPSEVAAIVRDIWKACDSKSGDCTCRADVNAYLQRRKEKLIFNNEFSGLLESE